MRNSYTYSYKYSTDRPYYDAPLNVFIVQVPTMTSDGDPSASPSAATAASSADPVFKTLSADDDDHQPTEIESLCVECGQNVSKE